MDYCAATNCQRKVYDGEQLCQKCLARALQIIERDEGDRERHEFAEDVGAIMDAERRSYAGACPHSVTVRGCASCEDRNERAQRAASEVARRRERPIVWPVGAIPIKEPTTLHDIPATSGGCMVPHHPYLDETGHTATCRTCRRCGLAVPPWKRSEPCNGPLPGEPPA